MTYEELVKQVQEAYADADASKVKEHLAIQFNVEGEAAGAFYLEVAEGKVSVQPYEYYDRDALVTTKAAVLEEIAAGKLDVVKAFLTGKIKVEGNVGKAALLKEIPVKSPAKGKTKKKQNMEKDNGEKLGKPGKAMELEPENARYHDSLGVTLHAMGRHEDAASKKRKAVELEPSNAAYHISGYYPVCSRKI